MDRSPIPIVAVASSAGDLEPVCELLCASPAPCREAFVIVQYPESGRHDLSLAETLKRRTNLPVIEVHDGIVPERGHVYAIRANTTLTIIDGRISVTGANGLHRPGDTLFVSLAEERGKGAIGVVLSGAGSDGALGVKAIRNRGGATFAQYPGSARFPSMPIGAIETGCVDFVLRPNEIAHELARLSPYPTHATPCPEAWAQPPLGRAGGNAVFVATHR
jgi:two-component system, chemotaxis family, CheB/CheR fusion protein